MPQIVNNIIDVNLNPKAITRAAFAGISASNFAPGSRIRFTDMKDAQFYSTGGLWKPVMGRQTLYIRQGSIASPIATLTGNGTQQAFTLPETLLIPRGLLTDTTKLYAEALLRRGGTAASITCGLTLGTTQTTQNDQSFAAQTITATDTNEGRIFGSAQIFSSTTSYISTGFMAANATGSASSALRSTNVNTAADMYVSIGSTSASFISPDTLALISYHIWIEG